MLSCRLAHCQAGGRAVGCLGLTAAWGLASCWATTYHKIYSQETTRLSLALAKEPAAGTLVLLGLCVSAAKKSSRRLLLLLLLLRLRRTLTKETTSGRLLLGCAKQTPALLLLGLLLLRLGRTKESSALLLLLLRLSRAKESSALLLLGLLLLRLS